MGMKLILAAAAVAVGAAAFAPPVSAEPGTDPNQQQRDELFAKAVRDKGLRISTKEAMDIAQSTCDVLKRGQPVYKALEHVKNATGWTSEKDITALGQLSVQAYCPTALPAS
jgi:hypothetical protein